MAPKTSTRHAPVARTYFSEPVLRQRRFPPRLRSSAPTTRSSTSSSSTTKPQKTLDYVHIIPSSISSDEEILSSPPHQDFDESRSKKRRRMGDERAADQKRQSTLTQLPFFGTDGAVMGDAEEGLQPTGHEELGDEQGSLWQRSIFQGAPANDKENSDMIHEDAPEWPESSVGVLQPSRSHYTSSDTSTPQRFARREIPSSQSPSLSPLSTQSDGQSPIKRMPLQEIRLNVVAKRDQASQDKIDKEKIVSKSKVIPDSAEAAESDMENVEPDSASDSDDDGSSSPSPPSKLTPFTMHSSPPIDALASSPELPGTASMPPPSFRPSTAQTQSRDSGTVRTSQATTVDVTQPSQRLAPAPHSSNPQSGRFTPSPERPATHPPASPSANGEPYTLATIDSQYPVDDLSNITPISSPVENNEVLDSANAALPSSMEFS